MSDGWSSGSYHPERDLEMRHTTVFTCELRGPARPPTARGTSTDILDHRAPRYMLLYNSHEQSHISTINPSETEAFASAWRWIANTGAPPCCIPSQVFVDAPRSPGGQKASGSPWQELEGGSKECVEANQKKWGMLWSNRISSNKW